MAKDKTGFMALNMGEPDAPAAPNYGLLEQAGAYRGKAAEIEGEQTAATLKFVGEMGATAYQAYQYNEAATKAKAEMDMLIDPSKSWVGEQAQKAQADVLRNKSLLGQQMEEVDGAFRQVVEAANAKMIGPEQARARLASMMREQISANPGAAATIRKAFQDYTGNSNWDLEAMQYPFNAANQQLAMDKALRSEMEKIPVGYRVINGPDGKPLTALTVDDLVAGHKSRSGPGWDAYLNWAVQEQQKVRVDRIKTGLEGGKLSAEGATMEITNALDTAVDAAFNTVRIEMTGVNWAAKSAEEIIGGMEGYKSRINTEVTKQISALQAQAAKIDDQFQKRLINEKIAKVQEDADKRLKAMTADRDSYLSTIEFFKRKDKDTAQTLEAQAKVFDQMIGWGFTPNQILRMKTEEGRKQIYHETRNDPNSPLALGARQYERLQAAIMSRDFTAQAGAINDAKRLERINTITQAIINGEKMVDGKPIVTTDPDVGPALKNVEQKATDAAKKPVVDITDANLNELRANSVDMSDRKDTIDTYFNFFKSGKIDQIDKATADVLRNNVATRMKQWLTGSEDVHYPSKLKSLLQTNNLVLDANGLVAINRTMEAGTWQVAGDAQHMVEKVNKMIGLQALASGANPKDIASQFVDGVNKMPVYDRSMPAQYRRAQGRMLEDLAALAPDLPEPIRKAYEEWKNTVGVVKENKEQRTNNFLNLRVPGKDEFQGFATKEAAVVAYNRQLDRYAQGKTDNVKRTTVSDIIELWSNEKEKGSMSHKGYLDVLKKRGGLEPSTVIDTPEKRAQLIYAMQFAEVGAARMSLEEIRKVVIPKAKSPEERLAEGIDQQPVLQPIGAADPTKPLEIRNLPNTKVSPRKKGESTNDYFRRLMEEGANLDDIVLLKNAS